MLESTQQTKKIDLHCYVINHQWFTVAYIILRICRTQIHRCFPQRYLLVTLSLVINQKKKKKKERRKKKIKDLLVTLGEFP